MISLQEKHRKIIEEFNSQLQLNLNNKLLGQLLSLGIGQLRNQLKWQLQLQLHLNLHLSFERLSSIEMTQKIREILYSLE